MYETAGIYEARVLACVCVVVKNQGRWEDPFPLAFVCITHTIQKKKLRFD